MMDAHEDVWLMDAHSETVLTDLLQLYVDDTTIAAAVPRPAVNPVNRVVAAVLLNHPAPVRAPVVDVNLGHFGGHGHNVHNAVVEAPAIESIAEFVTRPLPDGSTPAMMLQQLIQAIR
jgi:hypothetical protein